MITEEEVKLAVEKGVALEITTRRGHSLTNGHVAALARKHGARLVINNDAHAPGDLVGKELREKVGLGAGLTKDEYRQAEANAWGDRPTVHVMCLLHVRDHNEIETR